MRNGRFGTLSVDLQAIAVAGSREFVSVHRQTLTRTDESLHRDVEPHRLLFKRSLENLFRLTSNRVRG